MYTNHIHADDLARACVAALLRGLPQRVVNVSDDTELRWATISTWRPSCAVCPDRRGVTRAEAQALMSPMAYSFMSESRRLDNRRMKCELKLQLRYPTVRDGL